MVCGCAHTVVTADKNLCSTAGGVRGLGFARTSNKVMFGGSRDMLPQFLGFKSLRLQSEECYVAKQGYSYM